MSCHSFRKLTGFGRPVVKLLSGGSRCGRNACLIGKRNVTTPADSGFLPSKVAVVTKTTRYEFEQQRYRYAGLSEEDLKQLVRVTVLTNTHSLNIFSFDQSCTFIAFPKHVLSAFRYTIAVINYVIARPQKVKHTVHKQLSVSYLKILWLFYIWFTERRYIVLWKQKQCLCAYRDLAEMLNSKVSVNIKDVDAPFWFGFASLH